MKYIAWIILMLISVVSVYAAESRIDLNASTLPVNGVVDLTFTLEENATLNISQGLNDSRILLSYPSSIFYENTSVMNVSVNYTVNDFPLNKSQMLNASIFLTSDVSNFSLEYFFFFNITYDLSTVNETHTFDISADRGNYFVNITTNVLPFNGSFTYDVNGLYNETMNITCTGFLQCPSSIVFNTLNHAVVLVNYFLPLNTSLGYTVDTITFSAGNVTRTYNVTYNVMLPDINLLTYQWKAECFNNATGDVNFDCVQDYILWNNNQLLDILQRARAAANKTCQDNTRNVTEYVVVGNVDKSITDLLDSCNNDRNTCRSQYNDLTNSHNTLSTQMSSCQMDLLKNESELMQGTYDASVKYKLQGDAAEAKGKRTVTWMIMIDIAAWILITIGVLGYRKIKEKQWRRF